MNTNATPAGKRIVKVLEVVDTREWEEVADGKWVAISGSGSENECARCGRLHEVHASVALEDGTVAVVGTGCMNEESLEAEVKARTSSAKTLARNRAKLAAAEKKLAAIEAVYAEVEKLEVPPVTKDERLSPIDKTMDPILVCGDAWIWVYDTTRESWAVDAWREKRTRERGVHPCDRSAAREEVKNLRKRIERAAAE